MPAEATAPVPRIAVCGVGLVGGSIVRALRATGRPWHVAAFDRDAELLRRLLGDGWIDAIVDDPADLFRRHDLVALCQPVGALLEFVRSQAESIATGRAIGLDVASVKGPVLAALAEAGEGARARFVPCHPIAGKARHGWDAAEADLFTGRRCVLTPDACTDPLAVARVRAFWAALGARVEDMAAARHDRIYAAISHLPQWLTYAYLHSLAVRPEAAAWPRHQGSGYRGFTRLGSSDPALWSDIVLHNRGALIEEIDALGLSLASLRRQLVAGDAPALIDSFARAQRFHAETSRDDPSDPSSPAASSASPFPPSDPPGASR